MSSTAKAGQDGQMDLKLEGETKPITTGQAGSRASKAASRGSAQAATEAPGKRMSDAGQEVDDP